MRPPARLRSFREQRLDLPNTLREYERHIEALGRTVRPSAIRPGGNVLLPYFFFYGVPLLVSVKNTGGFKGDQTNPCTFTYNIYHAQIDTFEPTRAMAIDLQPIGRLFSLGEYKPADEGTFAIAVPLGDEWKLIYCFDEKPVAEACSTS